MRREIHHQQPAARRHEARGAAQRPGRIVEIMQHLMHHHEVEARPGEGRRVDVALPQIDPRQPLPLQIGPGDRQHGVARIEAGGAAGEGASSPSMRPVPVPRSIRLPIGRVAEGVEHRGLDGGLGHVQRAQLVPFGRQPREEGLGGLGPLLADGVEPGAILRQRRRLALEPADQRVGQAGAGLGQPEERPGTLAVALDQPRLDQQLEMARDPRLRLAQDVGEVGDRKLALDQQRQDAQARLLRRRPQDAQCFGEGDRCRRMGAIIDIKICLCSISMRGKSLSRASGHQGDLAGLKSNAVPADTSMMAVGEPALDRPAPTAKPPRARPRRRRAGSPASGCRRRPRRHAGRSPPGRPAISSGIRDRPPPITITSGSRMFTTWAAARPSRSRWRGASPAPPHRRPGPRRRASPAPSRRCGGRGPPPAPDPDSQVSTQPRRPQ